MLSQDSKDIHQWFLIPSVVIDPAHPVTDTEAYMLPHSV